MVYVDPSRYAYWSLESVAYCGKGVILRLVPEKGMPRRILPTRSEEAQVFTIDRVTGVEEEISAGPLGRRTGLLNPTLKLAASDGGIRLPGWEVESYDPLRAGDVTSEKVAGRKALALRVSAPGSTGWHAVDVAQTVWPHRIRYSLFVTRDCDYIAPLPHFFAGIQVVGEDGFLYRQCFSDQVQRPTTITSFQNQIVTVEPGHLRRWETGLVDLDQLARYFPLHPSQDGFRIKLALEAHGTDAPSSPKERYSAFFGPIKN
ncbi:MAG: hypothetical protein WCE83_03825 [Candidatus Baltobacteraceae bacterium]